MISSIEINSRPIMDEMYGNGMDEIFGMELRSKGRNTIVIYFGWVV